MWSLGSFCCWRRTRISLLSGWRCTDWPSNLFIIMHIHNNVWWSIDHHNSCYRTSRVPTPSSPLTATSASQTGELLDFGKVLDEVELGEVASIIILFWAQILSLLIDVVALRTFPTGVMSSSKAPWPPGDHVAGLWPALDLEPIYQSNLFLSPAYLSSHGLFMLTILNIDACRWTLYIG